MNGTLSGGATLSGGRLILNGTDAFMRTAPLAAGVLARTLVARVAPSTLDQGGGGVMTIQDFSGNVFDSIAFAERQPRKCPAAGRVISRPAVSFSRFNRVPRVRHNFSNSRD